MARLIEIIGDCKLYQVQQTGDLLFSLSRSILYQQISGKAAESIHSKFLQLYPHSPFPTALDILNTPDEVLRGTGISRPKVLYLKDLAQKVLDGLPTLDQLQAMEDESIIVIDHGAIANYKKVKPIDIKELEFKRSRQQTESIWEIKLYKFVGFKQHF